ncbi:MAG: GTP 3',8-cyclase MoaA [Deltaproteobacteria bacterium]|jgi:cyclic pyranopterin phosphate synthase|nr:GTP 3',8-cyclase MoaA [Deltaproteobacteria bacterium]MBW2537856.1 GTP 3',8-cyclase MoaA [Deltaproteobacteria bacterium]
MVADSLGRQLQSLRLSVTDRCNLRCAYCMPAPSYVWLPRTEVLDFDELGRLVDVMVSLGVARVRLTGGEPLLRNDLPTLIAMLADKPGIADLALTTNGLLLQPKAQALRDAGLHRLTVSLDTLQPDRFHELCRVDGLAKVLAGIEAARAAGFGPLKLDAVVIRDRNADEILRLLEFAREAEAEMRFIEYMDVGGATEWTADQAVGAAEILATIEQGLGPARPIGERGAAPAARYELPDGQVFGIVASNSAPFCGECTRCRLTADGMWYPCLYSDRGIDLKAALRSGATDGELRSLLESRWTARRDRGAEQRADDDSRSPLSRQDLAEDPHREMHTRGG